MLRKPGQTVSWGEMNVGSRSTFISAGFRGKKIFPASGSSPSTWVVPGSGSRFQLAQLSGAEFRGCEFGSLAPWIIECWGIVAARYRACAWGR